MYFSSITNENFSIVPAFHSKSASAEIGNQYGYYHKDNQIVFYTTFLCCPCIYYLKHNNDFCFSFDMSQVQSWAELKQIQLTEVDLSYFKVENLNLKPSVRKNYRYKEILFIENWKAVTISQTGEIQVIPYNLPLFSLALIDNQKLFEEWINKYQQAIICFNQQSRFIPTLTGGLDTRYLTSFYSNLSLKQPYYLLKSIKPDGKNQKQKGEKEIEIAEKIWEQFGYQLQRIEEITYPYVTLSGMFNENTRMYQDANNPDYIFKYIQHSYSNERTYQIELMPYLDDIYLMFRQEINVFRCLMCLLFAHNLLHIPFVGTTTEFNKNPQGQLFFCVQKYQIPIYKAYQIINRWYPKEKEDN